MTSEEILDMAIAIFRHQGIKATRLEHIAVNLNLSVSFLCEQVGSKADLLLSAVSFEINREHEYIDRIREEETSLLGFIKKLYLHAVRFFFFIPSLFFQGFEKLSTSCQRVWFLYSLLTREL